MMIEQLKASLFELTYVIDRYKRKNIMDQLAAKVKDIVDATDVVFYMYNKWQLNEEIIHYTSNYTAAKMFMKHIPSDSFLNFFNESTIITMLREEHPLAENNGQIDVLLKIHKQEHFYGLILLRFDEEPSILEDDFDNVRVVLEQFLANFYNNRHHRFIQNRHQLLFQLSTQLHSVHRTTEVLEKVYQTTQIVYPSFDYYFLMSHEFETSSLPVKLIEYSKDTTLSPGIIALINNELKIEYDEEKQKTKIYSPMSGKQGVYGVFQIIIPQIVHLVRSEIRFIEEITNMVGRAIERTTLYQSSNQQVNDLQIINVASHELNVNLQLDEITATVKKHIYNSCYAEQIGVVFFKHEQYNESFEILPGSTDFFSTENGKSFVEYISHQFKRDPKPFLSGNYQIESMYIPYRSLMVIPMKTSDSVLGVIIIAHQNPYYFSFDKFKFMQSFVQHASLAFTNSILTERLKRLATTDHLTNLYSRSHIDNLIKKDMKQNEQGALILFDVDDFKKINDTYGHYIGDKVLIQVANIIQSEMKDKQIAARWGGEEFAIYLPSKNLDGATEKANIIRKKVIAHTDPQVSLSCGVSTWTKEHEDSIEKLFIRTDKALYEAKSSGKNKVVQHVWK